MTGASRRKRAQAVLFSAIMVLSMVAAGVGGLAGSAAAQDVTPAEGEVILLNSSGTELGGGPYSSIQGAIDAADESHPDAERVVVGPGNYAEIVTVDVSGLTLVGVDRPLIRAPDDFTGPGGTANVKVVEGASDITIRGFEVDTRGVGGSVPSGIILNGDEGEAINNVVSYSDQGANSQGFISGSGDGLLIKNNTIDDTVIAYSGDGTVQIINNTFEGPKIDEALWSTSSGSLTIQNNNFTDAEPGTATIKLTEQDVTVNGETEPEEKLSAITDSNDGVGTVLLQGDSFVGVTEEGEINDAIGVASADYTVQVEQGTYNIDDSIVLDSKNIEFVGKDATINVTADGGYTESTTAIQVYADGTTISGFSFENFLPRDGANAISLSGADNNGVEGATVTQNTFNATLDESDNQDDYSSTAVLAYQTTGEINVTNNNFDVSGPSVYAVYGTSDTEVNATSNWWGSASGPSNDAVTDNVEVDPWLDGPADGEGQTRVAATVGNEEFSSIQSAVNAAEDGDTVTVQSGQYDENISIDTPNVTVSGQGDDTVVNGLVYLNAEETELTDVAVEPDEFVRPDGEDGEIPNNDNQAVLVGASDTAVMNTSVNVSLDANGAFEEINAIQVFSADDITGVEITNNDITGTATNASAAGVAGISDQGETKNTYIYNNTIDVHGGYSFGVVTRASGGNNVRDTPRSVVVGNTIEATAEVSVAGIGYGIESTDETQVKASEQVIKGNNFDTGSIQHKASDGSLDLSANYWENVSEVEFITSRFDNDVQDGGDIIYDPVLTEPAEDIESGDDTEELRQYGSVLELKSDRSRALAVGFSARPDESVGEMFGEMDITGNAFVYDNDAGEYRDIDGDYVPSVGEVVVLTSEGGIDETVTVPIETNVDNKAATPESVSLNNGWNLVATGGTVGFDSSTLDIAGAEVQNDLQLQAQPVQPGLPEEAETALRAEHDDRHDGYTGAFEGTWIFVDDEPDSDAQLATGYAEDQSMEEYVFEVVYPNDPQAEYPGIPIRPGYPPAFGYPPEFIEEHPDLVRLGEDTDE